ncbi:hypothetical protein XBKB1_700033 [Xenorhabdus bovienii str. kraussei Becker Underwood]|uniref:Uncharacterized protein n=1 Tax=Xenorhabdus bovienii str. kraussei Becker Underwood TaxID=1398204 RepID=A0A077PZ34_XENBV|nr:hypothetical protein XBKB1_700033 [Xenorhabdus bovienii str. kraussei Becker Underwood]
MPEYILNKKTHCWQASSEFFFTSEYNQYEIVGINVKYDSKGTTDCDDSVPQRN